MTLGFRKHLSDPCPLTLTLSGEGSKFEFCRGLSMAFKICLAKLHLPSGEGWGEGKVNLLFKKIMFRIMANSIAAAAAFG